MTINQFLLFSILAPGFCFQSCKNHEKVLIDNTAPEAKVDSNNVGNVIKFKSYDLVDSPLTKQKFMTCLLPADWEVNYYSKWVKGDIDFPMKYGVVAEDTAGIEKFELFPVYSFEATSNNIGAKGDSIENSKDNVMRVTSVSGTATDAIKDFILPYCRKDLGNDYRIIDEKPLNNLNQITNNNTYINETGAIKIEYTRDNKTFEEIFFATIQKKYLPVNGYDSKCVWHISYACAFRALKGQLDDDMGILETIVASIRYNEKWHYKYNFAVQSLPQGVRYSFTDIKNSFDNAPEAHTLGDIKPVETLEREMSKAFDIYTLYNINIDGYINSNGNVIRFPKGYSIAWKNATGDDYELAENTRYRPSKTKGEQWVELKKNESLIVESYLIGCNP